MRRTLPGIAVGLLVVAACSGKSTKAGGLEVILETSDLKAGVDYDTIEVVVQQETAPGGAWHTIIDVPRRVPSEIALPSTVSIQAGSSADQEALIEVTALLAGAPVVQRGAQLQVPSDRIAELPIVLAQVCVGKVVICANGTCDPESGSCDASILVDPSTLRDYSPGDVRGPDASTATPDASDTGVDATETGTGVGSNSDAGVDATETGTGVGSNSDAGDAAADVEASTPCGPTDAGVGTLGCPCTTPAALACAGHAQKVTLVCGGSPLQWTQSSICGDGQLCDSRPGVTMGACAAIDATCASVAPGAPTCSDATHSVTCGPDLVSQAPAATCAGDTAVCLDGSCVACRPAATECVGNARATCGSNGSWSTPAACGGWCKGGQCLTVRKLTAGPDFNCALLSDASVACWGDNADGELGIGSRTNAPNPVLIAGLSATDISAGEIHACAVTTSGSVVCWGFNADGELGNASTNSSPSPVTVLNLPAALAVASGTSHSCAVTTSGGLACWGQNFFGQLGNGTQTAATSAVAIPNSSGQVAIAAMENTTCALGANGAVLCWGIDDVDELGNGGSSAPTTCGNSGDMQKCSTNPISVVSPINPLENLIQAKALSAEGEAGSVCALIADGTVDCWGDDSNGNLGDGKTTPTGTPAVVTGVTGATAITEGAFGGCAIVAGGALKCWGEAITAPANIAGVSGATALAMGESDMCIALADGTVECWGQNSNGQLGNGTTTNSPTPVKVVW